MKIRVEVKGLLVDPVSNTPMLVLRGPDEAAVLPIWVGVFEANAIALQMEGIETPRPMTHDLLRDVIQGLEARVVEVVVCDLCDSTYHASVNLDSPAGVISLDARPSDAIALALRAKAPIYVDERVLEAATTVEVGAEETEKTREWLQGLSAEEMGQYEM